MLNKFMFQSVNLNEIKVVTVCFKTSSTLKKLLVSSLLVFVFVFKQTDYIL